MLTVKHIACSPQGPGPEYDEALYPCYTVERKSNPERVLLFNEPRFVVGEFMDGLVYVMNDNGQTVASYDLRINEGQNSD